MSDLSNMLIEQMEEKRITKEELAEEIDIDYLIHDILIIKAESVKNKKVFEYADYLEKQLLKIKRGEAVWLTQEYSVQKSKMIST